MKRIPRSAAKLIALFIAVLLSFIIASRRKAVKAFIPIRLIQEANFREQQPNSNACTSPLSLMFVKTHKTGSTSVKYLLDKFQRKRRFRNQTEIVAFPISFVGGYPGSFRRDFCYLGSKSTYRRLRPGEKVDFLTPHQRFDKEEVQAVMNPAAKYVTIIRHPLTQFESSFHYYYAMQAGKTTSVSTINCRMYPYMYVTNGQWVNFSDYITIADKSLDESAPWFFRNRNFQAYDLGLDPLNLDKDYVLQQAKELDETFHLVMILEHFLESLVLLKDLLCMDWKDLALAGSPRNQARYKKHTYSEREKEIIGKLTTQDQALYDYLNASLWRKIEIYGIERMAKDVSTLQRHMDEISAGKRNQTSISRPSVPRGPKRTARDSDREVQLFVTKILKKSQKVPEEEVRGISIYMVQNYGWCPV